MSRIVVAVTVWFEIVNAKAIPTAASPVVDVAAAVVVEADDVCDAVTDTPPVADRPEPGPILAVVVTFEIVIPIPAATDTPPPEAPLAASVVAAFSVARAR